MTVDEGHYYIYFFCNNVWKSKFMALENSWEFFLLVCGHSFSVCATFRRLVMQPFYRPH